MMEARLRYFVRCPMLGAEGLAIVEPILELVATPEDAERLRFVGSPTVLVDGRDPFAGGEVTFGYAVEPSPSVLLHLRYAERGSSAAT